MKEIKRHNKTIGCANKRSASLSSAKSKNLDGTLIAANDCYICETYRGNYGYFSDVSLQTSTVSGSRRDRISATQTFRAFLARKVSWD